MNPPFAFILSGGVRLMGREYSTERGGIDRLRDFRSFNCQSPDRTILVAATAIIEGVDHEVSPESIIGIECEDRVYNIENCQFTTVTIAMPSEEETP